MAELNNLIHMFDLFPFDFKFPIFRGFAVIIGFRNAENCSVNSRECTAQWQVIAKLSFKTISMQKEWLDRSEIAAPAF